MSEVSQELPIQNCVEQDPMWTEFLRCLNEIEPEQVQFVTGPYSASLPCFLLIAVDNQTVVGFLRFGVQALGSEERAPELKRNGATLSEAKIHAFAVRPEYRGRGLGTRLQQAAIAAAREAGCYQLSSHTSYDRVENCALKLKLGFGAVVDDGRSIRFVMPLGT